MAIVFLVCLCLFGESSIVSAQESSDEANPATLSEAKAQYRQRIRTSLSTREERAGETLGNLSGSRYLQGKCVSAKQSYRKSEREFSEIEASLTNEYGDEAYKADLQRLKKQVAAALLSARQAALATGAQMSQRSELEAQLASIRKERESYEARWRTEDEPPQAYASRYVRLAPEITTRDRGQIAERERWGSQLQRMANLTKLPWEFSVCFPEESEKREEKMGGNSYPSPSKPIVKVVYFAAKGTKPDLTTVRSRMVQAKQWFKARDIGTFAFQVSTVYARKNKTFYQTNVWDKVNAELGLTCGDDENGMTVVIVDHSPVLRDTDTAIGIGQHCGEDYSAGFTGHAMVSYEQLSGAHGLATVVHEMGHALSLPQGDNSVPNAIMNPNIQRNPSTAVLLGEERRTLKKSPYFSQH
jgi:hypothetical protein